MFGFYTFNIWLLVDKRLKLLNKKVETRFRNIKEIHVMILLDLM